MAKNSVSLVSVMAGQENARDAINRAVAILANLPQSADTGAIAIYLDFAIRHVDGMTTPGEDEPAPTKAPRKRKKKAEPVAGKDGA